MFYKRNIPIFLFLISVIVASFLFQANQPLEASNISKRTACIGGMINSYPCQNVALLGHLPLEEMGVTDTENIKGNDHWGWQDSASERDFVIFGLRDGTAFIEVTEPTNPVYLGRLPAHVASETSIWWDMKVYEDHAFITADIPTNNGLQIFDLTQLTTLTNTQPITFTESAHYDGFQSSHNLWINEESGYLYAFRTAGDACESAVHMVNIQDPLNPEFAACFGDPPLSDAECVMYDGPDADYAGREICFVGSDDNVSIYDVSEPTSLTTTTLPIADFGYDGIQRAHQGSLTTDQAYWLLSDTMDEMMNGHNTRTHVIDVQDLDNPVYIGYYEHATTARDHNIYIVGNLMYQTNWRAGLYVFQLGDLSQLEITELGYFDVAPESNDIATSGSWSNYPWWGDNIVTVSSTDGGLFILQLDLPQKSYLPLIQK